MTSEDILMMIGDAKGSYVWDAQLVRDGNVPANRRMPAKRVWLLAATIALALLLVGCAVAYVLSVKNMEFAKETREYYDGFSQEVTLLSVQGVEGTPGYQATKEWYDWLENYDRDLAIYHSEEAFSEDFGEEYYAYNLYSREMKDKLDEICDKYGLELLGKMYVDPDMEGACQALQIAGIFRPDVAVSTASSSMSYYVNGAFRWEGTVQLEGQADRILLYRCNRKDAFSDLSASVGPEGSYEEWVYTTSYGVDVLMVLDHSGISASASLYADGGDYVYLVSMTETEWEPLPDKAGLEAYAEVLDFTVKPQQVSQEDLAKTEERREKADAEAEQNHFYYAGFQLRDNDAGIWYPPKGHDTGIETYLTYVKQWDDGQRQYYTLWDIDEDGVEEVFLGDAEGKLIEWLKEENGMVAVRFCNYICQGNVLEGVTTKGYWQDADQEIRREGIWYEYRRADHTALFHLFYDSQLDTWRQSTTYAWDDGRDLTAEEAQALREQYPRVELQMHPVAEYGG